MLNNTIRNEQELKGTKVKGEEFKLQAFPDDVVFILEDPEQSTGILMDKIKEYGEVAGLIINWDKAKLLTKNIHDEKARNLAIIAGLKLEKRLRLSRNKRV